VSYRERRAARAERLRAWSDKRQTRAAADLATGDQHRGDHAFNFQPGHIPERARLIARTDAAFASLAKADRMTSRADEIERQADRAIYSDDVDAPERLAAKLAALEAQRAAMKARNAAFRLEHKAELKTMAGAYARDLAMPHQGYELANLGGVITRTRKRLAELTPAPPLEPATMPVGATALERAGLSVVAEMTTPSRPGKAPRPVWTIRGNSAAWRALLLRLDATLYRGVYSFWDDPTDTLEAALLRIEASTAHVDALEALSCELCGEPAGDGGALCPACAVSR
jgi:hypothetical protein